MRRGECVSSKGQSEAAMWPWDQARRMKVFCSHDILLAGARTYGPRGRGRIRASLTGGQYYLVHIQKPDLS